MVRRKFRLSLHRKNEERKKFERVSALPVSLPLSCFTTRKATTIHSLLTKVLGFMFEGMHACMYNASMQLTDHIYTY